MHRYFVAWENGFDERGWKLIDLKRPFTTESDLDHFQSEVEAEAIEDAVIVNIEYLGLVEQPVMPDAANVIYRYFVSWIDEDSEPGSEMIDLNRMAHTQEDFAKIEAMISKYAENPTLRTVKFINALKIA